jgi:uncharacterized protein VirK/YbjX
MSLPSIVPPVAKGVGSAAPTLHKLASQLARPWMLLALDAKYALRKQLMRKFPLTYEILFTPGNLDERLVPAIAGHRRLKRLLDQPALAPLRARHPEILYRPYRRYLANSFGKGRRRAALLHHYSRFGACVGATFYQLLLQQRPPLWQQQLGGADFAIRISFTAALHHEGDLQLIFEIDSQPLYYVAFSITPGWLVDSSAQDALLIARVQGVAGNFEAIRRATKACRDVSPPALLMSAVQGIASALNVEVIAGVTNQEQLTANIDADRNVHFDYNAFWATYPGSASPGFHLISLPLRPKPLSQVDCTHRRRTRHKRQFKGEVASAAEQSFRALLR